MTALEWGHHIARTHGRTFTDEEMDWFLWEETAFPVCGLFHWTRQLHDLFDRLGDEAVTP